jgi:hypothetical protein
MLPRNELTGSPPTKQEEPVTGKTASREGLANVRLGILGYSEPEFK